MNSPPPDSGSPTILAVDDEIVARTMLDYFLKKAGYHVVVVESAAAARKHVAQHGPAAVHCVVTDYRMTGETGLELLLWLKQQDAALSVIMITATTERELVAETLRGGATDFLDKPIIEGRLLAAVAQGIDRTRRLREAAEMERAVSAVGRTQHHLFGLGAGAADQVEICFHPRHQAGGDFVNCFQLSPDRFLVLTADVSGHDLHAAFVSAYFQGMMRGMVESGQSIDAVLAKFNRFLIEEWGDRTTGTAATFASLSLCAVVVDRQRQTVAVSNHGSPQPWLLTPHGQPGACAAINGQPLGWFDDLNATACERACGNHDRLLLWTDGLEDLATELQVSPFSLATGLHRAQRQGRTPDLLARAKDDVLVVLVRLVAAAAAEDWLPVLDETFSGNQSSHIDSDQGRWERSLTTALPDLPETRRFDVLLALREAVLNAMLHGCQGRADRQGHLSVTVSPPQRLLRAVVHDPGAGHDFPETPAEPETEIADLHRGLSLIRRLATAVDHARHGADLLLDFRY